MFDTKIAFVVRQDLAVWQKLNVTAFLASGVFGAAPEAIGQAYQDRDGWRSRALSVQPVIVLTADLEMLRTIRRRASERDIAVALYIDEMFSTHHDAANRAAFAAFGMEDAKLAGLGLRAEPKVVDKVTKGARLHD